MYCFETASDVLGRKHGLEYGIHMIAPRRGDIFPILSVKVSACQEKGPSVTEDLRTFEQSIGLPFLSCFIVAYSNVERIPCDLRFPTPIRIAFLGDSNKAMLIWTDKSISQTDMLCSPKVFGIFVLVRMQPSKHFIVAKCFAGDGEDLWKIIPSYWANEHGE